MRRRWPLLRATAELLNAANGVRPLGREGYITIPVFAFGWPTTEMSPLYLTGSVFDAVRRGLRGDFRGPRGRIALALTAIAWALLWLIYRRNVASKPYFEEPLRESLGDDYEAIAAPPFFILHGEDDSIIPVPEGREFAEAMRNSSTSVVAYAEILHAQHAFDFYFGSPRALHRSGGGGIPVLGARAAHTIS